MNIYTHMINKDATSYILFISVTDKGSIGKTFKLRIKIIHRQTRTRVEMIVMERSFMRDVKLCFLSVKRLALCFCILTDLTFGEFSKVTKLDKRNLSVTKVGDKIIRWVSWRLRYPNQKCHTRRRFAAGKRFLFSPSVIHILILGKSIISLQAVVVGR